MKARNMAVRGIIIYQKLRHGVVGYPVSELGKQGGSPAQRPAGARIRKDESQTELALPLMRGDCAGEASSQRRDCPLQQTKEAGGSCTGKPGGTAELTLRPCCG